MFSKTHTSYSPWIIVGSDDKKKARLDSMRYVLATLEYEGKGSTSTSLVPDPSIVGRYFRSRKSID